MFQDEMFSTVKEDVAFFLPMILIDLLHHHDKEEDLIHVWSLLSFLNVDSQSPVVPFETPRERRISEESDRRLWEAKHSVLGDLGIEQAKAIRDWLEVAATWGSLDKFCRDEAAEAWAYWASRVEKHNPKTDSVPNGR